MDERYLIDSNNDEREHRATLMLFEQSIFYNCFYSGFFSDLGICCDNSWFLIEAKKDRFPETLIESGDIDIIAGALNNDRLDESSFSLKHIVAISVKCTYNNDHNIGSAHNGPKSKRISGVIKNLLKSGFNKVALLDIIVNQPGNDIFSGSEIASNALGSLIETIATGKKSTNPKTGSIQVYKRKPIDLASGHWIYSMGAARVGKNEAFRGSGMPHMLQSAVKNPLLKKPETIKNRSMLQGSLGTIFRDIDYDFFNINKLMLPINNSLFLIDCGKCKKIHPLHYFKYNTETKKLEEVCACNKF